MDPGPVVLSVVVPCRNAETHLPGLLDVLSRERSDGAWEVVVVDNGSNDATRAIAERHAGALAIRVVDAPDRHGPGYARNFGAAAATGEHLLFLDNDDLIAPGYLDAMRSALAEADLVGACVDVRTLNPPWAVESRPEPVVDGLFDHFGFLPYAELRPGRAPNGVRPARRVRRW
ncbi:MAG: glycosyltransferase family A protein [Acidimicrobiales bacterium]